MKLSIYLLFVFTFIIISCDNPKSNNESSSLEKSIEQLPYLTYQKENLFPGDGSLLRAEDGVALEDGRIIVVDQANGLTIN